MGRCDKCEWYVNGRCVLSNTKEKPENRCDEFADRDDDSYRDEVEDAD